MTLSAAQKSFIHHLVIKQHDEKRGIKDGSMSDALFAKDILHVHPNTLVNWKQSPEFSEALDKAIREYEEGRDYFKTILRYKALEELWVQYTRSSGTEKRHYLSMVLKETEEVEQYEETTDYQSMTDAQLADIYLKKGMAPPDGMSKSELARLAKGAT